MITRVLFFLSISSFFASCVHYEATCLAPFEEEAFCKVEGHQGVKVVARAFNKIDCHHYLDRNVLTLGYQPIQLFIENVSDKAYSFSLSRISLPVVTSEEVAMRAHPSTVGRIASYGASALMASSLFAIPAVVDGYSSLQANASLNKDFANKGAKDQMILPHSRANMILFVSKKNYQDTFTITLIETLTNSSLDIATHVH